MLEHGVDGVEQLDGDHDERLLGLLALRSLTEVDRAPLGATADGVDGGEIKGLAGNTRAHRRQAGRRDAPAALGDHRVEPGVRDERARIGEARQYAELPEQPRVPASWAARRMARGLAWARCWAVGNCARMPRARALSRSPRAVRCSGSTTSSCAMSWRR